MAKIKAKSKKQNKTNISPFKDYWDRTNYIIFGARIWNCNSRIYTYGSKSLG